MTPRQVSCSTRINAAGLHRAHRARHEHVDYHYASPCARCELCSQVAGRRRHFRVFTFISASREASRIRAAAAPQARLMASHACRHAPAHAFLGAGHAFQADGHQAFRAKKMRRLICFRCAEHRASRHAAATLRLRDSARPRSRSLPTRGVMADDMMMGPHAAALA